MEKTADTQQNKKRPLPNRTRSKCLKIKLSDSEFSYLEAMSKITEKNKTDFIFDALRGKDMTVILGMSDLYIELNRQITNFGQLERITKISNKPDELAKKIIDHRNRCWSLQMMIIKLSEIEGVIDVSTNYDDLKKTLLGMKDIAVALKEKTGNTKRQKQLMLRVNEEELELINRISDESGLSRTSCIVDAVRKKRVPMKSGIISYLKSFKNWGVEFNNAVWGANKNKDYENEKIEKMLSVHYALTEEFRKAIVELNGLLGGNGNASHTN